MNIIPKMGYHMKTKIKKTEKNLLAKLATASTLAVGVGVCKEFGWGFAVMVTGAMVWIDALVGTLKIKAYDDS